MVKKGKQKNLGFDELAAKAQLERSKEVLQENGFLVMPAVSTKGLAVCSNINDLVNFFYAKMYACNRNREIQPAKSVKNDRSNVSIFVKSRESQGVSKKRAIAECETIIKALLENESALCLDNPVMSTTVLTQKWIVDRAIAILNGESAEAEKIFRDRMERNLVLLEDDEDKILDKLNTMYDRVVKSASKEKD